MSDKYEASIWELATLKGAKENIEQSLKRNWINWLIHPRLWFDPKLRAREMERLEEMKKLFNELL